MEIHPLALDGALLIRGRRFSDPRGYFEELWSDAKLAEAGLTLRFVQDNLSLSSAPNTLRGLHFQRPPYAQGKLVRVLTGAIRDVVVDVRPGSATYGRHSVVELSEDEPVQVWVPEGFLHGFVTLAPNTRVLYRVTAPYAPGHEGAVAWDDPDLAIDWRVSEPILSDKDAAAPSLRAAGFAPPSA